MNTRGMKHITHFGANQVFDSAITYTCIALFNSAPTESFRFKRFDLSEDHEADLSKDALYADLRYDDVASASGLYGGNQWVFFNEPKGFDVFKKLSQQTSKASNEIEAFVGLQTSRDALYISELLDDPGNGSLKILVNPKQSNRPPIPTTERLVESELFKPFIVGKETQRYKSLNTSKVVFFPYDSNGVLVATKYLRQKPANENDCRLGLEAAARCSLY